MIIFKNKLSVLNIFLEITALAMFAVFLYFALNYPLFYIGAALFGACFLGTYHKSSFLILKQDGIIYRKYFIWKKLKFNKIESLYIVKHSYMTRGGTGDFRDGKDKKVQGCIFFVKPQPNIPESSLENSLKTAFEWSNFYFDVQYKDCIIRNLLCGGFTGEIYITCEMSQIMGEALNKLLKEHNFNPSNLKIIGGT